MKLRLFTLVTFIITIMSVVIFGSTDLHAAPPSCTYTFDPASAQPGQSIKITVAKTDSGFKYEARIGGGIASPQQKSSGSDLTFELAAPSTDGSYTVVATESGFGNCTATNGSTLTVVNQAPAVVPPVGPAGPTGPVGPAQPPANNPGGTTGQPANTNSSSCTGFIDCLNPIKSPTLSKFSDTGLVGTLVSTIIPVALGIGGMLTVIFIIISGIQFVTSGGDPKGAAAAKDRLVYAIIGFIILILAYAILQIIDKLFLGTGVAG